MTRRAAIISHEGPRRAGARRRRRAVPPRRRPGTSAPRAYLRVLVGSGLTVAMHFCVLATVRAGRGRGRAAAVRGGRGAGGLRRRTGRVGARRRRPPVVPGVGVPLHPAAADVPGARPPRQGVPELALAAARLLPAQVRFAVANPPSSLPSPASVSLFFRRVVRLTSSCTANIACAGCKNPMPLLLLGVRNAGTVPPPCYACSRNLQETVKKALVSEGRSYYSCLLSVFIFPFSFFLQRLKRHTR